MGSVTGKASISAKVCMGGQWPILAQLCRRREILRISFWWFILRSDPTGRQFRLVPSRGHDST